MIKLNKLIYIFLALVLLLLVSCKTTNESDVVTAQKIKDMMPSTDVKETVLESVNTTAKKTEAVDPFLNSSVHDCAIFSREDGIKYCNFPRQASEKTEFSCQQAFSSGGLPPYNQVGIKTITYASSNEAREKFLTDTFSLQGKKIKPYLSFQIQKSMPKS